MIRNTLPCKTTPWDIFLDFGRKHSSYSSSFLISQKSILSLNLALPVDQMCAKAAVDTFWSELPFLGSIVGPSAPVAHHLRTGNHQTIFWDKRTFQQKNKRSWSYISQLKHYLAACTPSISKHWHYASFACLWFCNINQYCQRFKQQLSIFGVHRKYASRSFSISSS